MSNYIKPHSLSVGYNVDGQEFFDTLLMYENYIHSYFFSLTDTIGCFDINTDKVIKSFDGVDTYGFHANLLLNTKKAENLWIDLIKKSIDIVNLKAITVLTPELAVDIKNKYPDLDIHLSVRYWDYNMDKSCDELLDNITDIVQEYIDVVNISDVRSFNDFEFADKVRSFGCKTKFIVNEGCIINRTKNYSKFPGFENSGCAGSPCDITCDKLTEEYKWMIFSRALYYKEFSLFWKHQYDILKISTRHTGTYEILHDPAHREHLPLTLHSRILGRETRRPRHCRPLPCRTPR